MINGKTITLIAVSTDRFETTAKVVRHCKKIFPYFDNIKILTNFDGSEDNISIEKIGITSYREYNNFFVESLVNYIDTDFCLTVQDDGFILNPNLWDNDFLNYDYIGAPWPWHGVCGNGGFSLRSLNFLRLSSKLKYEEFHHEYDCAPEDWFLCVKNRAYFLLNKIKFAPLDLAQSFSFETKIGLPNEGTHYSFGFHGKHNL